MSKYDTSMLEETLKIQIRDDYFSSFRMTQIGRIDFAISKANTKGGSLDLFDNFDQYFLWALAKWPIRPGTPWFNADSLASLDDRGIGI